MATAVFIKSESADHYLYCYDDDLTEKTALRLAEHDCPEERECWSDWLVTLSD